MNIQPLLSYIQNFVELPDEEISYLRTSLTSRKYLKGQFVLQQGDICKMSSFIIKGCTKMFYVDDDGQEHIIMLGIEDWWVSDIGSFINQTPSDFNIQCLEDTELIQFPFDRMEDIYAEIPKLERFFRKIVERGLAATQRRILRNFSLNAKERYLIFKESYPSIEQRIPQYMIASYLGITKEFLSKIKSQIAQEG